MKEIKMEKVVKVRFKVVHLKAIKMKRVAEERMNWEPQTASEERDKIDLLTWL